MINLYNADCMNVMRNMDSNSVDLCVTDIPYGVINFKSNGLRKAGTLDKGKANLITFNISEFLSELNRLVHGSIYIFCATEQVSEIRKNLSKFGLSTRLIIWEKTNPSPMNGQHIWLSGVECCVYGKRKGAIFNGHCLNTVLRYPCGRNKLHPTQKPLDLIKKLIEISSDRGGVVFDPCMGSGTTGVACAKSNRNFIGIELDKGYFNIAKERIEQAERENAK